MCRTKVWLREWDPVLEKKFDLINKIKKKSGDVGSPYAGFAELQREFLFRPNGIHLSRVSSMFSLKILVLFFLGARVWTIINKMKPGKKNLRNERQLWSECPISNFWLFFKTLSFAKIICGCAQSFISILFFITMNSKSLVSP